MEEMIANCYSRAYAAALSCNDDGISPQAEATKAVTNLARLMLKCRAPMDPHYWQRVLENLEA